MNCAPWRFICDAESRTLVCDLRQMWRLRLSFAVFATYVGGVSTAMRLTVPHSFPSIPDAKVVQIPKRSVVLSCVSSNLFIMSTVSQTHFLLQQEMSDIVVQNDGGWESCAYSRRCPGKETPNEDAVGIIRLDDDTVVYAVADGCGGMRGGELASSIALQVLADSLEKHDGGPDRLRVAILDGIEQANTAVQDLKIGAACTIAVVECHRGVIRPYHVGDSMILVTGIRGKIRYQSVSHSPVGFAVESGMLCATEAMHHEDRHIVSNVVGDPRMRIEIGPSVTLSQRDTVVIASDGLFDNLKIEEVVEHIRKGKLPTAFASLTKLANERMLGIEGQPCKPDDLSVVAVRPLQL